MTDHAFPTESALQSAIVKELRKLGVWVIRTGVSKKRGPGGTQSGEPGMPDLLLPQGGWIEVKQPGKDLDPDQVAWHKRAAKSGLRVTTVRSVREAVETAMAWRADRRSA